MSEDTAVLFPGKSVTVMGETILVEPFSFVTIMTKASKLARSFAGSLKTGNVMDIIADGGEDILKMVELAVPGKPVEWWSKLQPDDGVALIAAVLEVNRDFFIQRLQKPLETLVKAIGEPLSPNSSVPATPGEPSSTIP